MPYNEIAERMCANCGKSLAGRRPQAKYCSARCRNNAGHLRRYHADVEAARARGREKARRRRDAKAAAAVPALTPWARLRTKLVFLLAPIIAALPL